MLDCAILRTLIYADVFDFPMTAPEIHRYLIQQAADLQDVKTALQQPSAWLATYIDEDRLNGEPLYALIERAPQLFAKRQHREQASAALWADAVRYGAWLGRLPFVRMVAMTGALSVRNAPDADDDLDYILVVKDGRVWLSRLFAVMLVRLVRMFGTELCPNYVLSESSLVQDRADLFMAHEVTQMVPIMGSDVYQSMRDNNAWSAFYLPNATGAGFIEPDHTPRRAYAVLKGFTELVLGGAIGNWLENWEMQRKVRKFAAQTQKSVEMKLDALRVKGHTMNYGQRTLAAYEAAVQAAGLLAKPEGYGAEAAD